MSAPRKDAVIVVGNNASASGGKNEVAIAGEHGTATTLTEGLSYAGFLGTSQTGAYGVSICGSNGTASGGPESAVVGYDGVKAEGAAGAVVWVRHGGKIQSAENGIAIGAHASATAGLQGLAIVFDRYGNDDGKGRPGHAKAGERGIAIARRNGTGFTEGASIVAEAGADGIAISYDGYKVKGKNGALLVVGYRDTNGVLQFKTGRVDGKTLQPDQAYTVDDSGNWVP